MTNMNLHNVFLDILLSEAMETICLAKCLKDLGSQEQLRKVV